MRTSNLGRDLIKNFETLHDGDLKKIGLQPKQCPSGIWTVGYGHALRDINGSWLRGVDGYRRLLEIYPDLETITTEEANEILNEDLIFFENKIMSLGIKLSQYQFDALVSFTFNCGFGNLLKSTLLRRIKGEKGSIREAFLMFNKSNGVALPGLTRRRSAEATLFETGTLML